MPALIVYKFLKVSLKTLKFAKDWLWQGCKVGLSQYASISKVAMAPSMEFPSKPLRPLLTLMFDTMYLPFQKLWRKQRTSGAWSQPVHVTPRSWASCAPSTRARCWFWMVKKLDPYVSSQRSKPLWFQYCPTYERSLAIMGHIFVLASA